MIQRREVHSLLTWDKIDEKDDFIITYLLYLEGKSIDLISRIRNLNKEIVEDHIINGKSIYNSEKQNIDDDFFIQLLASTKDERIRAINLLSKDEKINLARYLLKKIPLIENAEDKMIGLWIAGELKEDVLIPVIHKEAMHKHGGVRRMACSALGKISSPSSIDVLHKCLQDVKPQVRQYASNALKSIGNDRTIKRLKNLLNNPKELPYVRRSYQDTIRIIEDRLTGC